MEKNIEIRNEFIKNYYEERMKQCKSYEELTELNKLLGKVEYIINVDTEKEAQEKAKELTGNNYAAMNIRAILNEVLEESVFTL